ncbi:MAG: long-chain fatty acid--CoA ligase [Actinobacteria bacterium]|nr:long-chain fatty acid--CoA ligase [Actinomycetota bacterium]
MREFTVPPTETIADEANLTDMVVDHATQRPDHVLFSRPTGDTWSAVTARQFAAEVTAVAKGLVAAGVHAGDRVALASRTRYEWTLVDYAIWTAGAVTVPIYPTSSAEQVRWILSDSGAVCCVLETTEHAATVETMRDDLPALTRVWQIEDGAIAALTAEGAAVSDEEIAGRRSAVRADDPATIIYTSGTTGRPKGCLLTHRNLLFGTVTATGTLDEIFRDDASTLLFLPLAHVLARQLQCGTIYRGVRLGHAPDVKNLLADLAAFRPTFILAVPRVFERVYNGAKQKAHADGKGAIFDLAERVAIGYSRSLDRGGPGLLLRAEHALFDRLVYRKLRAVLGGSCTAAISGGAPLGERLAHFFRGIGVLVFEGYGLTETTSATTGNPQRAQRLGTVGRPIPGTTIRIGEDGEVLARGDNVFTRYWNNAEATREALDADGWLHTGDIGELDSDGFLRITGRKKELIVTASGKNVAPAVLEDRLRAHWLVSQVMVVGDRRPFVGALVTIDPEAWPAWKAQHGKPAEATLAELRQDPALLAEVQAAVNSANEAVSQAESIRKFRILDRDFTEATGELTPSLKLKRHVVLKEFADDVEAIYQKDPAAAG